MLGVVSFGLLGCFHGLAFKMAALVLRLTLDEEHAQLIKKI